MDEGYKRYEEFLDVINKDILSAVDKAINISMSECNSFSNPTNLIDKRIDEMLDIIVFYIKSRKLAMNQYYSDVDNCKTIKGKKVKND